MKRSLVVGVRCGLGRSERETGREGDRQREREGSKLQMLSGELRTVGLRRGPRGCWGRLGAVLGQSWGGLGGVDILLVFPIESALGEAKNNSHGGNGAFLLQNHRGIMSQRAQRLRRDYVLSEVWENRKKTKKKMKFSISVRKHCNRTLK